MDEVCSLQLLTSVRHMVLTLTQQNDEGKEFVRFFHRQLGRILKVRPVAVRVQADQMKSLCATLQLFSCSRTLLVNLWVVL